MTPEAIGRLEEYLDRVAAALSGLPPADRDAICQDVRQHVEEALADGPGGVDDVEAVLDALGPPEDYAERQAAPRPRPGLALSLLAEPFVLVALIALILANISLLLDLRFGILALIEGAITVAAGGVLRAIAALGPGVMTPGRPGRVPFAFAAFAALQAAGTGVLYAGGFHMILGGEASVERCMTTILPAHLTLVCAAFIGFWIALGIPVRLRHVRGPAGG